MNRIKAVIVDDEEVLREHLRKKISLLWPEIVILGEAGDGNSAIELIKEQLPDIVFLDIKMPGLSGMEVAKKFAGKCLVVFITAYDQYAIEAFENEAIDYILKPITDDKLKKMINRLQNKISASIKTSIGMIEIIEKITNRLQHSPQYLQWIKVKHGSNIRILPVDEIYYFKADNKYTLIKTRDNEYLIKKTIKELSDEIDLNKFWQIHRSAIVNIHYIDKISRTFTARYEIKLKDIPDKLIVSRPYMHLFKNI